MEIINLGYNLEQSYRDDSIGLTIYELKDNSNIEFSNGIELTTPRVTFSDDNIKKFIILRDNQLPDDDFFKDNKVYSVDFTYGDIDFKRLQRDKEYKEKMLKYVFSREALDGVVKNACGLLPADVSIDKTGKNIQYLYFEGMAEKVLNGVLKASYRTEVKDEEDEPEELEELVEQEIDTSYDKFSKFAKRAEGYGSGKKRLSFREVIKEWDAERKENARKYKEQVDRRRRRYDGEDVPEPIDYADEGDLDKFGKDLLLIFYRTGIVVREHPLEDGGTKIDVSSRYSVCYRDMENHKLKDMITILIAGVDDAELAKKGEVRDNFIKDIITPLIDYQELCGDFEVDIIHVPWPYIIKFEPTLHASVSPTDSESRIFYETLNKKIMEKNKAKSTDEQDINEVR